MLTSQRKTLILDRLRQDGQVIAKQIAEEFSLSEDTIRRDLRELAAEKLLRRVHGGAMPLSPDLPDLSARRAIATDAKARLGVKAASLIRAGQTIFLDGGTSNAQIVRALPADMPLTVVTHSPTIAAELEHKPAIDIILIGGRIYRHSMVATGAAAMAQISLLRPDLFFVGATAAHPARGLSTGDFEEAAIKRHIAGCSAETFVLLTQDKLDAISPCVILPMTALSGMIVAVESKGADPAAAGDAMQQQQRLAPYRALDLAILEA